MCLSSNQRFQSFFMRTLLIDAHLVFPGSALTPDQDGLHLGRHGDPVTRLSLTSPTLVTTHHLLLPSAGLMMPSSSATPACVAIPPLLLFLHRSTWSSWPARQCSQRSRVHTGTRVLCLLDEAGHVFQEEVVHVLLIHFPEFAAAQVHLGENEG